MSKMNLILDLKGYEGSNANTCNSNFRKQLQYIGIDIEDSAVQEVAVPASSTVALFSVATADAKKFIYTNLEQASAYALKEAEKLVDKALATPEKYDDNIVLMSLGCINRIGEALCIGATELKEKFENK